MPVPVNLADPPAGNQIGATAAPEEGLAGAEKQAYHVAEMSRNPQGMRHRSRRARASQLLAAVAVAALGGSLVAAPLLPATPARADVPPAPVGEFFADECVGDTDDDPTNAPDVLSDPDDGDSPLVPPPVPDLTRVWGARLADYNAGHVVALYDAWGSNSTDGFPPVCGVRYVASSGGPVSEWLFCTHIWRAVCAGTDAAGNLLDYNGNVIPGHRAVSGNPDLTPEQERLVAYLIRNGAPYTGVGYYDFGATEGQAHLGSGERSALQVLIWCITDPVADPAPSPSEVDRKATCAASMPPEEQHRLLALIPEDPVVVLDFEEAGAPEEPGTPLVTSLTTNLFEQPIELATSNPADIQVVSGDAMLTGTTLTVAPAAGTRTIVLRVTPAGADAVDIVATARPAQRSTLQWNQPGVGDACQVFATFSERNVVEVSDSTRLAYRSSAGGPAELARSGVELAAGAVAVAVAFIALGALLRRVA